MVLDKVMEPIDKLRKREVYFFALFRCFEATLLIFWFFSPFSSLPSEPTSYSTLQLLSLSYLAIAVLILISARFNHKNVFIFWTLVIDVFVFCMLALLLPQSFYNIAYIMLVNLAAGGLLLFATQSSLLTLSAICILAVHYVYSRFTGLSAVNLAQSIMLATSYSASVLFCQLLAKQAQSIQDLANERGNQLAEMAQLNELIIQRMRTGIIVLDKNHRVLLCNQSANQLNNKHIDREVLLSSLSAVLDKRLMEWRSDPQLRPQALSLYEGGPEVIPRFVAITLNEVIYLIFLEDSRVFSGRAEELHLAQLGRLSASIAHEIRNPLAAISYAQQLLSESNALTVSERGMLDIIGTQSIRMNGIIENILNLAKRETAQPQNIELTGFAKRFVAEFLVTHPENASQISVYSPDSAITGLFDPLHLYQILNILVNNALTYGHYEHEAVDLKISVRLHNQQPIIDVIDKGPGIADAIVPRLFTPFYSTSEHGTGLGLYIAKQLAESNQAQLAYLPQQMLGSTFRLSLSSGQGLLSRKAQDSVML